MRILVVLWLFLASCGGEDCEPDPPRQGPPTDTADHCTTEDAGLR